MMLSSLKLIFSKAGFKWIRGSTVPSDANSCNVLMPVSSSFPDLRTVPLQLATKWLVSASHLPRQPKYLELNKKTLEYMDGYEKCTSASLFSKISCANF